MLIYLEACEAGSIFGGLLKQRLNILAVTAANPHQSPYNTLNIKAIFRLYIFEIFFVILKSFASK